MKQKVILIFSFVMILCSLSGCNNANKTSSSAVLDSENEISITTDTNEAVETSTIVGEEEPVVTTEVVDVPIAETTTQVVLPVETTTMSKSAQDALARLNGGGNSAKETTTSDSGNISVAIENPTKNPTPATTTTTTTAPSNMAVSNTGEWLSGYEHKPLQCNVKPNQLYWGTTSMTQMNNIAEELNYLFNDRTANDEGDGCTITMIEFYYNRDIVKNNFNETIKNNYQKIPASKFEATEANFEMWMTMCGSLSEYYGIGSSDGGMNDNAYIAYSTYMDSGFRTGANANCDCGGCAQFDRSVFNYLGYETRYVTGRQYGTNHAGYQVRCKDTGAIKTCGISKQNIQSYGAWE